MYIETIGNAEYKVAFATEKQRLQWLQGHYFNQGTENA